MFRILGNYKVTVVMDIDQYPLPNYPTCLLHLEEGRNFPTRFGRPINSFFGMRTPRSI